MTTAMRVQRDPGDAQTMEAAMSRFPQQFEADVDVEEVDLDAIDVSYGGAPLTEPRAELLAAEVLARTPGRLPRHVC